MARDYDAWVYVNNCQPVHSHPGHPSLPGGVEKGLGYIPDHIYNFILNYVDETAVEV